MVISNQTLYAPNSEELQLGTYKQSRQICMQIFNAANHWSGLRFMKHHKHWTIAETHLGYSAVASIPVILPALPLVERRDVGVDHLKGLDLGPDGS